MPALNYWIDTVAGVFALSDLKYKTCLYSWQGWGKIRVVLNK